MRLLFRYVTAVFQDLMAQISIEGHGLFWTLLDVRWQMLYASLSWHVEIRSTVGSLVSIGVMCRWRDSLPAVFGSHVHLPVFVGTYNQNSVLSHRSHVPVYRYNSVVNQIHRYAGYTLIFSKLYRSIMSQTAWLKSRDCSMIADIRIFTHISRKL